MKLLNKTCKKSVSILLSAVMIISLFAIVPFTAYAEDTLLSEDTTVTQDTVYDSRILCEGDVTLTLSEGATVTVHGGIHLTGDASLTINGTGSLIIDGVDDNCAGIGGNEDESLSSLTINGGTINVTGGSNGAGIGGGLNGSCGKVTINGGAVTTHGGEGGAGIGTGALDEGINGDAAEDDGVYISGGTVTSTGGSYAAGIGEGYNIDALTEGDMEANISISGGTVTAYSNNITPETQNPNRTKQDIGGDSTTISITGGNVWARGGGIASENQVAFGWSMVSDSIYSFVINADVLLTKDFKSQENENDYFNKDQIYVPEGNTHPLELKTLITPYADSDFFSTTYIDENGTEQTVNKALRVNSDMTEFPGGWVAVDSDISNNNRIVCSGDVYLILCDDCTLTAPIGITVSEGSSLTIYGQSGCTGKLISGINGSSNPNAGIGGKEGQNSGSVTIVGGEITAYGGSDSAGIGGGFGGNGTVTIRCSEQYRAEVYAYGGINAAGIGGARDGAGTVNIYGGKVTAFGGTRGAGIGGGRNVYGNKNLISTINIYGGSVEAVSELNGAGIGTGYGEGGVGIINISGGYVIARNGSGGAGIGGGYYGAGSVTISGGEVHASAGENGAGIGSGDRGDRAGNSSTVKVSGGNVYATGGKYGAGIGGGWKSSCSVTISGGYVYATRGDSAFGIGNGYDSSNNSTISLSWTNRNDDSIYSSSYGGTVTLEKSFKNKDNDSEVFTPGTASVDALANKTIVPYVAYTVTWKNYDGSVLKSDYLAEGTVPSYDGETPQMPGSGNTSYTFKGWTDGTTSYAAGDTLPAVTGDITYTAEFTEAVYVAQVEPYLDNELDYHLGVIEHYEIDGKNYAVNADGTVGNELPSVDLSYFEFKLINNSTEYQINYYTGPTDNLSELVIPKTFNEKSITVLGSDYEDTLINYDGKTKTQFELKLNENIKEIKKYTFYTMWVTKVTGNTSGLNRIGNYAFSWANSPDGYKVDIQLDYEGTVQCGSEIFNHMDVTLRLKHATKLSTSSTSALSIEYIFTDAHPYGEPVWTWTEGFESATAKFTCPDSRCKDEQILDAEVAMEATLEIIRYTATVEFEGEIYTDVKESDNEIGSRLVGHSLSLDGDIGVNFYMDLSASVVEHKDSAYMYFTIPTNAGPQYQTVYVKDAKIKTVDYKDYYVFKCTVAAKEMTSNIQAQLFDPAGGKFGEVYTYSVKEYAKYLLENAYKDDGVTVKNPTFANAVPLVKALLNYGSYAQIHFDKNIDNLASDGLLTAEETDVSSVTAETINKPNHEEDFTLPEGLELKYDGATLSLKSQTSLSLYFLSDQPLTFECSTNEVETVQNIDYWVARIRNIASGEAQKDFIVTVKIDGSSVGTITYSPLNYCYNVLSNSENTDLKNVVRAFYLYTEAAKEYFAQVNGGN